MIGLSGAFGIFALLFLFGLPGCIQQPGNIAVAFYNCENLFDTTDNPAKADEDFTPGGKYRYTQKVYEQKLHNIATAMQGMALPYGPAIAGLAEVENSQVLNDLCRQPEIARRNYKYIIYNGPDARGINVALIYDPQRFTVLQSRALNVPVSGATRDILHITGILAGDTVQVFVNHWPSRRGEGEGKIRRGLAAQVLGSAINQATSVTPHAKIIVMGDFNDNPADASISTVLGALPVVQPGSNALYNPWRAIYDAGQGTEHFQATWNLFDQIMISEALMGDGHLQFGNADIYRPAFLTQQGKSQQGAPKRSFARGRWNNGYSDHFPVLVHFSVK